MVIVGSGLTSRVGTRSAASPDSAPAAAARLGAVLPEEAGADLRGSEAVSSPLAAVAAANGLTVLLALMAAKDTLAAEAPASSAI